MVEVSGTIFNIQRFSTEDGPGIRTTVFLKGCPLRCPWCANPESIIATRQLVYRESLCKGCGNCLKACSLQAIELISAEGKIKPKVDRSKCNNCGACVEACTAGAMHFFGQTVTADEVFREVIKDKGFYGKSGGGVTASGGEALMQPDFVAELFRQCHRVGIHTTLDTCGYFDTSAWDKVGEHVDLVLFDIKLMDREKHKQCVGKYNDIILQNARLISQQRVPMIIRIPLIPGINDTEENLNETARFVCEIDKTLHIDLLPYHNYGENKYKMLGKSYQLAGVKSPNEEHLQWCQDIFTRYGLDCAIN